MSNKINKIKNCYFYIKKKWNKIIKIFLLCTCVFILIWMHYFVLFSFNKKNNQNFFQDKKNVITLGVHNNIPPFIFDGYDAKYSVPTENGETISGIDILLCKELADQMGKKLSIKIYDFAGLLSALETGKVDFALGLMNATDKRKEKMLVVEYCEPEVGIMVRKEHQPFFEQHLDKKDNIISLSNLRKSFDENSKIKLSTMTGCVFDEKVRNYLDKDEHNVFDKDSIYLTREDIVKCVNLLDKKVTDVLILDKILLDNYIENDEEQKFVSFTLKNDFVVSNLGMFIKKNNPNLKSELEEALTKIKNKMPNYMDVFKEKALEDLRYVQKKINSNKNESFVKKILISFPSYIKSFFMSFILALDGLILGFFAALFLVKIKIFSEDIEKNSFLFYIRKWFFIAIEFFINFLKSVPISVQALLFFNLFISSFDVFKGFLGTFYISLIVIVLNTAANLMHIMIENIRFLDQGQIEAAYALGMEKKQVFRYIIFDQSIKRTYPSIFSQFLNNIKDTALFSIIGLMSLLWTAQRNISITYDSVIPYFIVSLIYFVLVSFTNLLVFFTQKDK
ncbi:transporter substrate-binding domain-containing protein [Texas Phoenix palm phytoplasma]|uniref:Transporter substrate-binding domain-containing protein n=1 Tax=Texas Phoenix palm phytoplasma TaxID=176709 RepID=A0ABS5BJ99_9MOLU|nr:transporter substrate-binding domain-containing protein [Texas Phoenix palm phytoplasma]MBP3059269.1 transporter substrate-binding domain-containing protein [Texas Phoenix palm phytoplasma]